MNAYERCPNCLYFYRLDESRTPSESAALWRFRGYLLLDFLGFVIIWQAIVFGIFGLVVYSDPNGARFKLFGEDYPGPYFWATYAVSMVLFLAILGLISSCFGCCYFCCLKEQEENSVNPYGSSGNNCALCYYHSSGNDCCCCCCCDGDCNCDCNNCNVKDCCDSDGDAKALLIIVLVIIIAFAIVGLFVLLYFGTSFLARRYNRRTQKLLYLAHTKEERVMDLSTVPTEERDTLPHIRKRF